MDKLLGMGQCGISPIVHTKYHEVRSACHGSGGQAQAEYRCHRPRLKIISGGNDEGSTVIRAS